MESYSENKLSGVSGYFSSQSRCFRRSVVQRCEVLSMYVIRWEYSSYCRKYLGLGRVLLSFL